MKGVISEIGFTVSNFGFGLRRKFARYRKYNIFNP